VEFPSYPPPFNILQFKNLERQFAQSSGTLLNDGFKLHLVGAEAGFGSLSGLNLPRQSLGTLLQLGYFAGLILFDNP
jgi:hypothetical protein